LVFSYARHSACTPTAASRPAEPLRSHVGLNKGEQQNALRRAVFFNRLGEIRDRSYEKPAPSRQRFKPARRGHYSVEYDLLQAPSITCAIKGTIQPLVIWPICRHSAGSTSI
jgi:hypothetical protein